MITRKSLYEKASKCSGQKTLTTFQAEPQTAGNTKQIANATHHTENIQRLRRATKVNVMVPNSIYRLPVTADEANVEGEGRSVLGSVVDGGCTIMEDHAKVRGTLEHLARDRRRGAFGLNGVQRVGERGARAPVTDVPAYSTQGSVSDLASTEYLQPHSTSLRTSAARSE